MPAPAAPEPAPAPAPAPEIVPEPVAAATTTGNRIKASPLAKKIAAEKGIDLATIHGSGPSGRIVKADVENAQPGAAAPAADQATSPKPVEAAATLEALEIPVSNMRKSIGKALVASKTQAPHFYLQIEVNGAPLAALRKELNTKLANLPPEHGGTTVSYTHLTLPTNREV